VCADVTSVNEALNVLLCRKHDLIALPATLNHNNKNNPENNSETV